MYKILVPTDFSKVSQNAFKYALEMASDRNASIDLVHIHSGHLSPGDPFTTFSPNKTTKDILHKRLTYFVEDTMKSMPKSTSSIEIEILSIVGLNTSKSICKISKDYNLIIMGSTGDNNILKKIIGSTASSITQNAQCPVMVIPKNISYKGFEKIVYASNWESAKPIIIQKISDWAREFNSSIDFVHITEINEQESFDRTKEKIIETLFDKENCSFSFNVLSILDKSILNGIQNYALKNNASMVILVNNKKGLFSNLFGQSLTNKIIPNLKIPILVYHTKKEELLETTA